MTLSSQNVSIYIKNIHWTHFCPPRPRIGFHDTLLQILPIFHNGSAQRSLPPLERSEPSILALSPTRQARAPGALVAHWPFPKAGGRSYSLAKSDQSRSALIGRERRGIMKGDCWLADGPNGGC